MPGALGYGWHEGNRGEYLAQYFLTALGVSTPVIRQEDIGIDFYCALAREDNRKLTFHSPYMVQHGAAGSKDFSYGGYTHGKWRHDQIDWLFSQELPLFVCTVDQSKARFCLYATSAMWLVRYRFGQMNEIELCPDAQHDPLNESRSEKQVGPDGDGYAYRVPLGNPIVELTVFDLNKETRRKAIEALTRAIDVEQRNITFRRLGVHVASWFRTITPNESASLMLGGSIFWNGTRGQNVPQQIDSLKDIAVTLALNLDAQGSTDQLQSLAPAFGLFRRSAFPPWILDKLPRVVADQIS